MEIDDVMYVAKNIDPNRRPQDTYLVWYGEKASIWTNKLDGAARYLISMVAEDIASFRPDLKVEFVTEESERLLHQKENSL